MPQLLINGPESPITVALAHGAGAPMDSPFMAFFAEGIAAAGFRVARFEFPYMAARRDTGRRPAPDRAPRLRQAWAEVIEELQREQLVIGGKSLGGRIASLMADEARPRAYLSGVSLPPGGQARSVADRAFGGSADARVDRARRARSVWNQSGGIRLSAIVADQIPLAGRWGSQFQTTEGIRPHRAAKLVRRRHRRRRIPQHSYLK